MDQSVKHRRRTLGSAVAITLALIPIWYPFFGMGIMRASFHFCAGGAQTLSVLTCDYVGSIVSAAEYPLQISTGLFPFYDQYLDFVAGIFGLSVAFAI